MAHFDSVVTDYGAQVLAAVIAGGGSLQLSGAAAGKGRYVGSPAQITALVDPLTIPVDMGEKTSTALPASCESPYRSQIRG